MFDSNAFYKKRLTSHIKELSRYLRYIFNGHTAIAILFLIAAAAYYYQNWLQQMPENFPTALVIGVVYGFIASYSRVRTLLEEPDVVFLAPAEHQMRAYFRNSILYSFFVQLYLVLLAAAALGPLYAESFPERSGNLYLLTFVILLIFKFANLIANWWMYNIRDVNYRRLEIFVRTLMNIFVFYFIVKGEMVAAGIGTLLFAALFLYDYVQAKNQPGVLWDVLLEKEQNSMQTFYRIANMFSDVPHIKTKVKKRNWLVSLVTKNIPFEKRASFDYLYRITFIRSGDYAGMYLRLLIIGGVFIYIIPNFWVKLAFVILFLYLSSFQMMSLYRHHRTIMWLDIYPVDKENRQQAMVKLIHQLNLFKTVIFALVFLPLGEFIGALLAFACGIVFTFAFVQLYVKKKLV